MDTTFWYENEQFLSYAEARRSAVETASKLTREQLLSHYAHKATRNTYAYIDQSGYLRFTEKKDSHSRPADEFSSIGYLLKIQPA